jgi:hypothetical protein
MIALDKWVPFYYYSNGFYFIYFLVLKEYKKNYHCDIHIKLWRPYKVIVVCKHPLYHAYLNGGLLGKCVEMNFICVELVNMETPC